MSGRIDPNRPGYGNVSGYPPGYGCIGITPIAINCTNCDGNYYLRIPTVFAGVISNTEWDDYQDFDSEGPVVPSPLVPTSYTHPCQDAFDQGFLEVEYPDVAPVSVRGISTKSSTATIPEPLEICTVCWEYDRGATTKAFYYDEDNIQRFTGDLEPADPRAYASKDVASSYQQNCSENYDPEEYDEIVKTVLFVHCPCSPSVYTRQVITDVWLDDDAGVKTLKYRFEEWKFDGNRLVEINDTGVCENTTFPTTGSEWETDIIGVDDCPEEE